MALLLQGISMRVFTFLLFVLTIIAGCLSYNGMGTLTETVKLMYAYLALLTLACAAICLTMRPEAQRPASRQMADLGSVEHVS